MHCKKSDCFSCPYPDCINDYVRKPQKYTERRAAYVRKKKDERIKAGLCPYCGKRPPSDGHKTCGWCRAYFRQNKSKSMRNAGIIPKDMLNGVDRCSKCGKYPPKQGQMLCERCYEQALAALSKTPTHNGKKNSGYFTQFNEVFYAG